MKKKIFIYQSTLKGEVRCESIMSVNPQLATRGPLINLAYVQMTSNLAQACTVTCQMMFAPRPAYLV